MDRGKLMRHVSRLDLETTYNTRELGGIPLGDKKQVKWNKVLRSDDISNLSPADIHQLKEYGITTVIDLRSEEERQKTGYILSDNEEFKKHYISLMITENVENVMNIMESETDLSLIDFYCHLLENGMSAFKEIFSVFADQQKTGVLFHCAGGKDRTGVVAALLLNLLGAKDGDIIANYEVTFSYLFSDATFETSQIPQQFANSDRENMVAFLKQLKKDYGNAHNYLLACGLTESQLDKIKELFTTKG